MAFAPLGRLEPGMTGVRRIIRIFDQPNTPTNLWIYTFAKAAGCPLPKK